MLPSDDAGRFAFPSDSHALRRRVRREETEALEVFGLRLMESSRCTNPDKEEVRHCGMKKVASVRDWLHHSSRWSVATTHSEPFARVLLGLVVGRVFVQATLMASHPYITTSNDGQCKGGAMSISTPPTVELCTTGNNPNLNESFFNLQKKSTVGANQSYVVVGLLAGCGGRVAVILTVIDRDYSWLTAGDLTDVIRLEEKREERTRKRRELRGLNSLPSGGSSAEIGAEIYCDAMEVDICDTSSGGSAVDESEIAQVSSVMGCGTSSSYFHKSISMTTLIAMAGDGSVTSRRGSVSKYSRTSTDDVESCKRDFGFKRPEVHSKYQDFLSDLSFTSTIKWHSPPLEVDEDIGRLTGFKRLLRRSQDTASSCSSYSSEYSGFSLRRLLCCGGEDWSDDDDY